MNPFAPGSVPPGSVPAGLAPAGSAPPPRGPRSGRRDARPGRKPKSGLRLTRRARIIGVLVVVAALLSVGLTTGFGSEPSAQPAVQSFLLAWQQQRYQDAGALTTSQPATVATALKNAFAQLDATQLFLTMDSVTQHGDTAQASFTASVDLAGGHVWSYRGQFGLSHGDGGWKVQWSPSVVYPGLSQGQRLAVVTQFPDRAPVLDAEGQPLQVLGSVYILGVTPAKLANPAATATAFAKITNLDASQVLGQIEAAPPKQVLELASLDPATYASLRSALQGVPGLVVQQQRKRLFQAEATGLIGGVGNEINPVLRNEGAYYVPGTTVGLSGLEQTYQRQLLGTPTTEVVAITAGGTQTGVLARWPGAAGTPVRTTISSATQDAALSALNGVPGSGDIVAVRASTGEVLAIAQRHGSGSAAVDALNAKLAPGPAFTIVSAAALLGSGLTSSSQLTCGNVAHPGRPDLHQQGHRVDRAVQQGLRRRVQHGPGQRLPAPHRRRARPGRQGLRHRGQLVRAAGAGLLRLGPGQRLRGTARRADPRAGERPDEPAGHGHGRRGGRFGPLAHAALPGRLGRSGRDRAQPGQHVPAAQPDAHRGHLRVGPGGQPVR